MAVAPAVGEKKKGSEGATKAREKEREKEREAGGG